MSDDESIEYDKKSYCSCCGAEYFELKGKTVVGECFTDCMWYEGEQDKDYNPH